MSVRDRHPVAQLEEPTNSTGVRMGCQRLDRYELHKGIFVGGVKACHRGMPRVPLLFLGQDALNVNTYLSVGGARLNQGIVVEFAESLQSPQRVGLLRAISQLANVFDKWR